MYHKIGGLQVRELGVVAVRPAMLPPGADELFLPLRLDVAGVASFLDRESRTERQLAAFGEAGWRFLSSDAEKILGRRPPFLHRMYAYESGQIKIGLPRLVAKLKTSASPIDLEKLLESHPVVAHRELHFGPDTLTIMTLPGSAEPLEVADAMRDEFEYVEVDMLEYLAPRSAVEIPTRASDDRLWHHHKLRLQEAWAMTRGEGVTIGVIDFGFCLGLSPLAKALDGRGGWSRFGCDSSPRLVTSNEEMPSDHHGTFCAAMAVARGASSGDALGVAPGATLLPLACLRGAETQLTLVEAIHYAAGFPRSPAYRAPASPAVDVITASIELLDGSQMTLAMKDALAWAGERGRDGKGVSIFWSVANASQPIETDPVCGSGLVMPVGACDDHDEPLYGRSAFGPALAFLAPGIHVYGLAMDGSITSATGSSCAAPCAAGIAALVLSRNRNLTAKQVRTVLEESCVRKQQISEDYGGYDSRHHNPYYGHGRVEALGAVTHT
jgi:subtilisin family serine protease